VATDAGGDAQAGRAQPIGHHGGRAPFLPRHLGVPMDVPAEPDQWTVEAGRRRVDRVAARLCLCLCRRAGRQPRRGHTGRRTTEHRAPTDEVIL
jgi:hypothetical protein